MPYGNPHCVCVCVCVCVGRVQATVQVSATHLRHSIVCVGRVQTTVQVTATHLRHSIVCVCVSEEYRLQYRSLRLRKKLCGNLQAVCHVATKNRLLSQAKSMHTCQNDTQHELVIGL